jgi:hypothetical protein
MGRNEGDRTVQAPWFEVDPMWPKPLPHHWLLGNVIGVGVDSQDHIWIIHRGEGTLDRKEIYAAANPPAADCCQLRLSSSSINRATKHPRRLALGARYDFDARRNSSSSVATCSGCSCCTQWPARSTRCVPL